MGKTLYDYCRDTENLTLLQQWHPTKNEGLRPEDVSYGSHRKVWWRCNEGHEWVAQVKSRAVGSGCPYCAGRKILPGENDLGTTHPELSTQWNRTKNGTLRPENVIAGTRKKVWWQCEKGHAWQASIQSRTGLGTGCPVCAGKVTISGENDLATRFPELAAQWDRERNDTLCPEQVTAYSNRKVWWRCELGHRWQAPIGVRVNRNTGCPYCTGRKVLPGFNDLATIQPKVAAQWHPTLNGDLTPEQVTAGSQKRVWWQCEEGHVWKAVIYSRAASQKCGCPACAGRGQTDRHRRYQKVTKEQQTLSGAGRV